MRELIVNADDFGYSSERDAGILACWAAGGITSASLLVNGATAATAARSAARVAMPIGLHFNLTEGAPLCTAHVPTLVGADGRLRGKAALWRASEAGEVDAEDVARELRAQLARFGALSDGAAPSHCDGHQHVHVIRDLAAVIAATLQRAGVRRTRIPYEPTAWLDASAELVAQPARHAFCRSVVRSALEARAVYAQHDVLAPHAFIGNAVMGAAMSAASLARHVRLLGGGRGCVELMVHPGNVSRANSVERGGCVGGGGPDAFACSAEREHERDVLCAHIDELCANEVLTRRSFANFEAGAFPAAAAERSTERGTVVVLARLQPQTGNCVTALRFRRALRAAGHSVALVDLRSATAAVLADALAPLDGRPRAVAVLALHLHRCAPLLAAVLDDGAPPLIVCFAGTDSSSTLPASLASVDDNDVRVAVNATVRRAAAFVAFHDAMAESSCVVLAAVRARSGGAPFSADARSTVRTIPQALWIELDAVEALRPPEGTAGWLRTACSAVGCDADAPLLLLPCGIRAVKDPAFAVEAMAAWHARLRTVARAGAADAQASPAIPVPPAPVLVIVGHTLDAACGAALHGAIRRAARAGINSDGDAEVVGGGAAAGGGANATAAEMARCGVVVLDCVPRAQLMSAVAYEAAAVVNTSQSEGQPMALMEAMALETLVIARDIPANRALLGRAQGGVKGGAEGGAEGAECGLLFHTPDEFVHAAEFALRRSQTSVAVIGALVAAAKARIATQHSDREEAAAYAALVRDVVAAAAVPDAAGAVGGGGWRGRVI